MTSVTQSVSNYLGGISKQTDYTKLPGQVKECLNAYPDPTFGLTKRPGFKWMQELATTSLSDAKWFYIHRDGDEQYIGRIKSGGSGDIAIWNAVSGVSCSIAYTSPAQTYLNTTKDNYDLLTVQDTTIVTNKTKVVTETAATAYTAKTKATIKVDKVEYGSKYSVTIGGQTTAAYITRNEDHWTVGSSSNDQLLNAQEILTQLKTNILALNSALAGTISITQLTASLELEYKDGSNNPLAFDITATDDAGNTRLSYFQEQVNTIADLPLESTDGRVVKVINTGSSSDTYYTKFIPTDGTSGAGYWEETVKPGISTSMNASTLPHELFNDGVNSFKFRQATWTGRLVGDTVTNESPSFVGEKIQQTFLHNNRLGILTEDNVVMSKSGDLFNFFYTSALTSTDADPIDISCSSIRPALLHGIVPTAQGLILFSKNQQFMLFADDGAITPSTAIIRGISNYEMDTNIDPIDVGTNINFVSKTASYTRVFGMQTRGYEENPIVQDISKAVSDWIPSSVDNIFSSPQNEVTGLYDSSSGYIYMYRTYNVGKDTLMQSWFNWKLSGNVQHCVIDNDVIWAVVENGTKYHLLKAYLSKSVEDDIIETDSGQKINPYMDMYTNARNGIDATAAGYKTVVYENDYSKCYIPFTDVTDLTPILVIKGSGVTESGFTITPSRATDGDGTYFKVPGLNLVSQAANVYVGYKYNYDVELPKTYFKIGGDDNKADYTAMLTVARMKFAVGLSSDIAFKIKRKGYIGPSADFTGNGSTTVFKVSFPLKEENGVKITLDGAVTTAYTVIDEDTHGGGTVTFTGGAPAGDVDNGDNTTTPAQKIKITTDTWYDSQPSKEAGEYLADDVPLVEESIYTVPIHQRTNNFDIRVFSNSPFPVSLNSMMWEGNYSPRFYRRT